MLYKFVVKYKLYHIPFWCIYFTLFLSPFILKLAFYIPIELCAVYFNLYFLIPKYLEKGQFGRYITGLIFTLLIASMCIVSGYYLTAFLAHTTVNELYGPGLCTYYFFGNAVPAVFASLVLSMCIRLTKVWIQSRRRQQLLEKEKLETELDFLKHQFNPHFLFNTINSIFFLIHKQPDTASESLARFSELLRYQLYECNDTQIPLSKEISYLQNSIQLEKLRQNDNVKVTLHVNSLSPDNPPSCDDSPSRDSSLFPGNLVIAPFILMTFVENAFKHVSKESDTPNWIAITLNLDHHQLDFVLSNSITHDSLSQEVQHSGIGLRNVRRRLELLYPGRHSLNIYTTGISYEVHLRLHLSPLTTNTLPHSTLSMPSTSVAEKGQWFTA